MDGIEEFWEVEISIEFGKVFHDRVHFLVIMMGGELFLGELLAAVALCKVLCLMVRYYFSFSDCLFDKLI